MRVLSFWFFENICTYHNLWHLPGLMNQSIHNLSQLLYYIIDLSTNSFIIDYSVFTYQDFYLPLDNELRLPHPNLVVERFERLFYYELRLFVVWFALMGGFTIISWRGFLWLQHHENQLHHGKSTCMFYHTCNSYVEIHEFFCFYGIVKTSLSLFILLCSSPASFV